MIALVVALIALVIFAVTRIGLAVYTGFETVPVSLWPGIFAKGIGFDFAVLTAMIAPVLLYEALLPNRWRASAVHRVLRAVWLTASVALLLFGAVAEITFWLEFSTRFNFIAVDYLLYTHEVIGNIRESYPVPLILGAIGILAAIIVGLLYRRLRRADGASLTWRDRVRLAVAAVLLPVATLTAASVDQMHGSGNAYADELSGNGLFTLAAAMRRNELDYDRFYRTMPQAAADALLVKLGVERKPLELILDTMGVDVADDTIPFTRRPRNVILISVESLSASFLGAYGSTAGLTPELDRLAREGLKFENVLATGTRTVRGLEALSLGTPPVPGQAIVRRPDNDHLATVGELLWHQGYSPYFFYGGYGYFDNMNEYFRANRYRVVDRTDFPKDSIMFANIWGVADEALFDNALKVLDADSASGKPFFAHIMTTSNHRPFTYPAGRIDIPSPGGRDGAVKYSDFAIGKFIGDAKAKSWFRDTLFIIIADHCASVAGKTSLPVANYRIPLIFYAPDILRTGTYKPMVSQIDLPPTIMEILGLPRDDHFFGRSFFEEGEPLERAFISNYQELGYLRKGVLTVLQPKGKVEAFRIDPKTDAATPTDADPQLLQEAIAYYQSAARAFKSGALRVQN